MQPIEKGPRGLQFVGNRIIQRLYDQSAGYKANEIVRDYFAGEYSQQEIEQFYQLLGYTLSGYGELDFISDESVDEAEVAAFHAGLRARTERK